MIRTFSEILDQLPSYYAPFNFFHGRKRPTQHVHLNNRKCMLTSGCRWPIFGSIKSDWTNNASSIAISTKLGLLVFGHLSMSPRQN